MLAVAVRRILNNREQFFSDIDLPKRYADGRGSPASGCGAKKYARKAYSFDRDPLSFKDRRGQ